jgi:hypothetical protein
MTMASAVLSTVSSVPGHVESDPISELARWIPDQLRKRASRFVLAQRVGDSAHHTVDEWTTAELTDANALAEVIYGTAVRDAQALKTSLAYGVFALRDDRPEPISRMYLRVDAGGGWMQSTDPPDERGVTAMLMRHTEASARLSLGHSRGILDQYERLLEQNTAHHTRLLDQAYARITALEAREIEALDLREKLQSIARERELELAQLARRSELRLFAVDKLSQLAPLILAKLGPAGERPGASTVGAIEVLEQLIVSITPEQFPQIVALLRPEQVAMLAHLYDIVEARAAAAATAAQASRTGPGTPATPSPETTTTQEKS